MYHVFIGVDRRSAIGYTVLQSSIVSRASKPVAITPIFIDNLPIRRRGLTDFTYSRYMVPYMMNYQGVGLFLDSDMLVLGDIVELFERYGQDWQPGEAVRVVKNKEKFEWPSVMLFNCSECKQLTPEYVNDKSRHPQSFEWAGRVGSLPPEWNHCVGYDAPRQDAKLVHYTMGIPEFKETARCEYAREWFIDKNLALNTCSWVELMGTSVHADKVLSHHGLKVVRA